MEDGTLSRIVYALKHVRTGQLLAAYQLNGQQVRQFRLLLWPTPPDEEARLEALGRAGVIIQPGDGRKKHDRLTSEWEQVQELGRWKSCELGAQQAKLANVMLRNQAERRVALCDGELLVLPQPSD